MTKGEALEVLGCSYSTLRRYAKKGLIRTYTYQIRGRKGKMNYWDEDVYALVGRKYEKDHWIVGYCRVQGRRPRDLEKLQEQKNLMREFCTRRGIALEKIYEDQGRGTDWSKKGRPDFHRLLRDVMQGRVQAVVIDTRCRLTRVAFEVCEEIFSYHGCDLVVMNPVLEDPYYLEEQSEDLTHLIQSAGLERALPGTQKKGTN
jgi:predicted site-specific integrase-resolvase